MADAALSIPRLNAQEYLERETDAAYKHEFVNGIVYAIAGASRRHNLITNGVFGSLDAGLAPPWQAFTIDIKVHIKSAADEQYYYPDVVVTRSDPDNNSHVVTQPTLIVEVISPTTEDADRGYKFNDYCKLASLQEYVLVQQERPSVELYRRRTNWQNETYGPDADITLESVQLPLSVAQLYRRATF